MRSLTLPAAVVAALVIAACGGSDDADQGSSTTASEATASSGSCAEIEELEVPPYEHDNRKFTVDDYLTIPPAGGDHTDAALAAGGSHGPEVELGAAVHTLEHGAVIAWTNGLEPDEMSAIETEVEAARAEGYYQLAIVELPELEGPFALSAWGAVQNCTEADPSAIKPFIEEWYASPKSAESVLACQGEARRLPPC